MNKKPGSKLPDIARRVANNLRTSHFIIESYYDETYEQVAEAAVLALQQVRKEAIEACIQLSESCDCEYDHDVCGGECCHSCCGDKIGRKMRQLLEVEEA